MRLPKEWTERWAEVDKKEKSFLEEFLSSLKGKKDTGGSLSSKRVLAEKEVRALRQAIDKAEGAEDKTSKRGKGAPALHHVCGIEMSVDPFAPPSPSAESAERAEKPSAALAGVLTALLSQKKEKREEGLTVAVSLLDELSGGRWSSFCEAASQLSSFEEAREDVEALIEGVRRQSVRKKSKEGGRSADDALSLFFAVARVVGAAAVGPALSDPRERRKMRERARRVRGPEEVEGREEDTDGEGSTGEDEEERGKEEGRRISGKKRGVAAEARGNRKKPRRDADREELLTVVDEEREWEIAQQLQDRGGLVGFGYIVAPCAFVTAFEVQSKRQLSISTGRVFTGFY